MPTDQKSSHKPRQLSLWFLFIGIVLFAGIYVIRSVLIAPYAIAFLQSTVVTHLGLDIEIGQLGGSYFSDIEIKNVTTEKRIADGLCVLRVRMIVQLEPLLQKLSKNFNLFNDVLSPTYQHFW